MVSSTFVFCLVAVSAVSMAHALSGVHNLIKRAVHRECSGDFHYTEKSTKSVSANIKGWCETLPEKMSKEQCARECFSCGFCHYSLYNAESKTCDLYKDISQDNCVPPRNPIDAARHVALNDNILLLTCIYCNQPDGSFVWSG